MNRIEMCIEMESMEECDKDLYIAEWLVWQKEIQYVAEFLRYNARVKHLYDSPIEFRRRRDKALSELRVCQDQRDRARRLAFA
jgi:hypothetical protein